MAVEGNKRKRKHADGETDSLTAVPLKRRQSSLVQDNENENSAIQNLESNSPAEQQHSKVENGEKFVNRSKSFNMLEFRTKLRGNNFITG